MFTNTMLKKIGPAAILNTRTKYHVKIDWTKAAVLGNSLRELKLTTVKRAPIGFFFFSREFSLPMHTSRVSRQDLTFVRLCPQAVGPGPDFFRTSHAQCQWLSRRTPYHQSTKTIVSGRLLVIYTGMSVGDRWSFTLVCQWETAGHLHWCVSGRLLVIYTGVSVGDCWLFTRVSGRLLFIYTGVSGRLLVIYTSVSVGDCWSFTLVSVGDCWSFTLVCQWETAGHLHWCASGRLLVIHSRVSGRLLVIHSRVSGRLLVIHSRVSVRDCWSFTLVCQWETAGHSLSGANGRQCWSLTLWWTQ